MSRARVEAAVPLLTLPAVAAAQQTSGFSHGWAYGLAAFVLVVAIFLAVFRRRPPPTGRHEDVAPPPR